MVAGIYDLIIEQGARLYRVLTVTDSGGSPRNLTGYTARAQVREEFTSSSAELEMTTEDPFYITLGGAAGTVTIDVPDTVTDDLTAPFTGVWDLELVDGSGNVERLVQGAVSIRPEVTR